MTTYVALLRAVNVSGQNRLPMAELRDRLTDAGLVDTRTHVQSGNVVFSTDHGDAPEAAAVVRDTIAREFGLDVVVIALSAKRMAQVVARNPLAVGTVDQRTLHATFLSAAVSAADFERLVLPAQAEEMAAFSEGVSPAGAAPDAATSQGSVIYLRLPHGYGRTKLSNAWFERALKTTATTRNWRTVLKLTGMAGG